MNPKCLVSTSEVSYAENQQQQQQNYDHHTLILDNDYEEILAQNCETTYAF